jgi:hypothetical protein
MSYKKYPTNKGASDLGIIIIILLGLFIIWVLVGGPSSQKSKDNMTINPLTDPVSSKRVFDGNLN